MPSAETICAAMALYLNGSSVPVIVVLQFIHIHQIEIASDGLQVTIRPLFRRERRQSVIAGDQVRQDAVPAELAVRELDHPIRGMELAFATVVMNVTLSTGIWLITFQRDRALSRLSHTSSPERNRFAT